MPTWRGALRELERVANRNARQRAYQEKQQAIVEMTENARSTLNQYNDLINNTISLHTKCCDALDWESIINRDPPKPITKNNHFETIARKKKQEYEPSRLGKFFGKAQKELSKLDEEIVLAVKRDDKRYRDQVEQYEIRLKEWEEEKNLASKVLNGEDEGIEEVLNTKISLKTNPFIGTEMNFHFEKGKRFEAEIVVHKIDEIIPSFELNQLKRGNLSKKDMPKTKRLEIYKEYVCSATIRIAREVFALLPEKEMLVDAKCDQLNEKSGYMEKVIILSVFIPRETLNEINFKYIKPSLAIDNFVHNIDFKKLSGFHEVEQVSIEDKGYNLAIN